MVVGDRRIGADLPSAGQVVGKGVEQTQLARRGVGRSPIALASNTEEVVWKDEGRPLLGLVSERDRRTNRVLIGTELGVRRAGKLEDGASGEDPVSEHARGRVEEQWKLDVSQPADMVEGIRAGCRVGDGLAEDDRDDRPRDQLPLVLAGSIERNGHHGLEDHVAADFGASCVQVTVVERWALEVEHESPDVCGRVGELGANAPEAAVLGPIVVLVTIRLHDDFVPRAVGRRVRPGGRRQKCQCADNAHQHQRSTLLCHDSSPTIDSSPAIDSSPSIGRRVHSPSWSCSTTPGTGPCG